MNASRFTRWRRKGVYGLVIILFLALCWHVEKRVEEGNKRAVERKLQEIFTGSVTTGAIEGEISSRLTIHKLLVSKPAESGRAYPGASAGPGTPGPDGWEAFPGVESITPTVRSPRNRPPTVRWVDRMDPMTWLHVEQVVFDYNILDVFSRGMPISAINLNQAKFSLTRDREGKWNIGRLFRQGKVGSRLYIPSVKIGEGSVIQIQDRFLEHSTFSGGPAYDVLVHSGEISQRNQGSEMFIEVTGSLTARSSAHIAIRYTRRRTESEWRNRPEISWELTGEAIPMEPFGSYLRDTRDIEYIGGLFDFRMTIDDFGPDRGRDTIAEVDLRDGVVMLTDSGREVYGINGHLGFKNGTWSTSILDFEVAGIQFHIPPNRNSYPVDSTQDFSIYLKTRPAGLDNFMDLAGVTLEASGETSLELNIDRVMGEMEYKGTLGCSRGMVGPVGFDNAFVLFSRHQKRTSISTIEIDCYGGKIRGNGMAETLERISPYQFKFSLGIMNSDGSICDGIDLARFFEDNMMLNKFGLKGIFYGTVELEGDLSGGRHVARGCIRVRDASLLGLNWKELEFSFTIKDNTLVLNDLNLFGGEDNPLKCRTFTLDLSQKDPLYCIELELSNMNLTNYLKFVPLSGNLAIDGNVENGVIRVEGRGLSVKAGKATANLNISDLRIGRFEFRQIEARMVYSAGRLNVDGTSLYGPFGQIDVSGAMNLDGEMDITFGCGDLHVMGAMRRFFPEVVNKLSNPSTAVMRGRITGGFDRPKISVGLEFDSVEVAGYRVTGLAMEGSYFDGTIDIISVSGLAGGMAISAMGSYGSRPGLSLHGKASCSDLGALSPGYGSAAGIKGEWAGDFTVFGLLDGLSYTLSGGVRDLTWFGLGGLAGNISVTGSVTPGFTTAIKGTLKDPTGGTFSLDGGDGKVALKGRALKFIYPKKGKQLVEVDADFDLSTAVTGSIRGVSGIVKVTRVAAGGVELWNLQAGMSFSDGILKINDGSIPGIGAFSGTYSEKGGDLDFTVTLKSPDRRKVFETVGIGDLGFEGLGGRLRITGTVAKPVADMKVTARRGKVLGIEVEDFSVLGKLNGGAFKLTSFEGKLGGGTLTIKGSGMTGGEIDICLDAKEISAGILAPLLGIDIGSLPAEDAWSPGSAKVSISSRLEGAWGSPRASIYLKIGSIYGFDQVDGVLFFRDGQILVHQILFRYRGQEIRVVGKVTPGDAAADATPVGLILDLAVAAKGFDLKTLSGKSGFGPEFKGKADIALSIKGSLAKPSINGTARVRSAGMRFLVFQEFIQVSDIDIGLKDERVVVVSKEKPGILNINGGFSLGFLSGGKGPLFKDVELTVKLPDYSFKAPQKVVKDLRKKFEFNGRLDGGMKIIGTSSALNCRGRLGVHNASMNFPLSGFGDLEKFSLGDHEVALTFDFGKNVWYRGALVSAEFDGSVTAGIQGSDIVFGGKVDLMRGKLNYISNEFDIIEGQLAFRNLSETVSRTFTGILGGVRMDGEFDLGRRLTDTDFKVKTDRHVVRLSERAHETRQKSDYSIQVRSVARLRDIDVYLLISGQGEDLQTFLYSDPPQDQAYINSLLTKGQGLEVNSDPEGNGRDAINLVGAELTNSIWKQFSATFAENFNLSEFSIKNSSMSSNSVQKPAVHLGKYLNDDLYFSYSKTLSDDAAGETMGLEYHLKRRLILDTEFKKDEDSRDFTMGLKFKRAF